MDEMSEMSQCSESVDDDVFAAEDDDGADALSDSSSHQTENDEDLANHMSDDEEKQDLCNALINKWTGKKQFQKGRRTYTQAKAVIRTIRRSRQGRFNRRTKSYANSMTTPKQKRPQSKKRAMSNPPKTNTPSANAAGRSNSLGRDGNSKLCFICGSESHLARDCPKNSANTVDFVLQEEVNMADGMPPPPTRSVAEQLEIAKAKVERLRKKKAEQEAERLKKEQEEKAALELAALQKELEELKAFESD